MLLPKSFQSELQLCNNTKSSIPQKRGDIDATTLWEFHEKGKWIKIQKSKPNSREKKKLVLLVKSIWLDKILTLSNDLVIVFNRVKDWIPLWHQRVTLFIVTCNVSPNIYKCDREGDHKSIMSLGDMTLDKQESK